ncbi:MAG: flagellar brake protein, partial [Lachnospiraceae bacterium]|nr:flagellar brake protein [Lachnospiraceae bacterium]
MLSKLIEIGNKIELQSLERGTVQTGEDTPKIYQSIVHEIVSDDTLEITMPIEQTKLILLPVNSEYELVFYTESGLYQCFARIIDRYKSNNVYILVVSLTSNLLKFQRRNYYRFSCALEMGARNLEEDELQAIEEKAQYTLQPGLPLKRSVIVDISGGGLRFMSSQRYEPDSYIYCSYNLLKAGEYKTYDVVGRVLAVKEMENRRGVYEHRVEYHNMGESVREEIIKF